MDHGPIGQAARDGKYDEVLKQTLVKVADVMDETRDARNSSALAIKIADLIERIEARDGDGSQKERKPGTEVSQFEVLAQRRAERRKAAAG